jgi:hypothetical protein
MSTSRQNARTAVFVFEGSEEIAAKLETEVMSQDLSFAQEIEVTEMAARLSWATEDRSVDSSTRQGED